MHLHMHLEFLDSHPEMQPGPHGGAEPRCHGAPRGGSQGLSEGDRGVRGGAPSASLAMAAFRSQDIDSALDFDLDLDLDS